MNQSQYVVVNGELSQPKLQLHSHLEISSAVTSDSGLYSCVVRNKAKAHKTVHFFVMIEGEFDWCDFRVSSQEFLEGKPHHSLYSVEACCVMAQLGHAYCDQCCVSLSESRTRTHLIGRHKRH